MMNQIVITREMISTLITQCSNVEPPKNIFKRKKSDLTVMLESAYSPGEAMILGEKTLLRLDRFLSSRKIYLPLMRMLLYREMLMTQKQEFQIGLFFNQLKRS